MIIVAELWQPEVVRRQKKLRKIELFLGKNYPLWGNFYSATQLWES